VTAWRIPVTSTAVLLVDATTGERWCFIRNDGGGNIYLGGPGVTDNDGFELGGNSVIGPVQVKQGRQLWAVRQNGNSTAHILTS
jgi:hypothetical protein